MMRIDSADNAKVKQWEKLKMNKYRNESGLFLVEGYHMVQEAVKADCLDTLLVKDGIDNPFDQEAVIVSEKVMKKLSENTSGNDFVAVCHKKEWGEIKGTRFIVLENVQDPGNVGTIIRTACSFGYDAVFVNNGCSSIFNSKTIQASQGAIFHVPVIMQSTSESYHWLKENGVRIYATALHADSINLSEVKVSDKYALVFGNEGQGLTAESIETADEVVKIEMENFESLNVSIAAGICSYYFRYGQK